MKEIQELEKLGAEVKCLEQPCNKDLCEALWDKQGYHIFVFTGHSRSEDDGQIGWIELNNTESLSIEDFKNALKEAINRGLQLAIFNSCDGLGLANQLAELHLPQSRVMREPVPDLVAVEFLKHFFQEFAHGSQSLFTSVHISRQRLEHFKSDYPGVDWLPVVCITDNVKKLLKWQDFREGCPTDDGQPSPHVQPISSVVIPDRRHIKKFMIAGFLTLVAGCGVAYWWWVNQQNNCILTGESAKICGYRFQDVSVPAGEWLYGGSTSWAKLNSVLHPKIQQELPQISLKYVQHPALPPSSETGIKMLINGQISFAQSSRPLESNESQDKQGFKLQQVPVANDLIAIVVHPSLDISGLSIQQLQDIYTGKITNWSQINPKLNLKITPYSRPIGESGTTGLFQNEVLRNQNYGTNVVFKFSTTTEIEQIIGRSDPGGIYYVSASEISRNLVKALPISRIGGNFVYPNQQGYPIFRRLFVIIKLDGQNDEKIGKAYSRLLLTDEGQKLIKEALKP